MLTHPSKCKHVRITTCVLYGTGMRGDGWDKSNHARPFHPLQNGILRFWNADSYHFWLSFSHDFACAGWVQRQRQKCWNSVTEAFFNGISIQDWKQKSPLQGVTEQCNTPAPECLGWGLGVWCALRQGLQMLQAVGPYYSHNKGTPTRLRRQTRSDSGRVSTPKIEYGHNVTSTGGSA